MGNIKIEKVWLTDTEVWIRTADGNEACEKISEFPRLKYATPEQRNRFTLSDEGIHWSEIDEDLCFEGFFREKNQILYTNYSSIIRNSMLPPLHADWASHKVYLHNISAVQRNLQKKDWKRFLA